MIDIRKVPAPLYADDLANPEVFGKAPKDEDEPMGYFTELRVDATGCPMHPRDFKSPKSFFSEKTVKSWGTSSDFVVGYWYDEEPIVL